MITKKRVLAITLLFVAFITGIRLIWLYPGWKSDQPLAAQGVLDLRGVSWSQPVLLEGQWAFYPERFLMREGAAASRTDEVLLQVPGSWKGHLADPKRTIGYGSYRLLVRLGDPAERQLALAMPGTATASEIYVDGVRLGGAGVPGTTADATVAFEGPYTVDFSTDRSEVEIVVHMANFGNAAQGGMLGSIQFGAEDAVRANKQFSIAMQLLVCIFLLIHVAYAVMLYILGGRKRALLTLALMMLSAGLSVLVTDDKLLVIWAALPYDISMKLNTLSYLWGAALLVSFVQQLYPELQRRPWHIYYGLAVLAVTIVDALLSPVYVSMVDIYTIPLLIAGFLYVPFLTLRATLRLDRDAIFLWLGFVALALNLGWGIWSSFNSAVHPRYFYPIDFIVLFFAFSSYWFRLFFRNSRQTATLAAELQKADKQKNDFLANTSHELRNPLHGMINIARSVLEEKPIDPAGRDRLELLIAVGRRMSLLLNDLIDLGRLQDKGLRLEPRPVRAQAAVAGIFDMMAFMLEGKPIELRNEIPDSLPPVMADENRLVQILFNLLHNAVKFTVQGHVAIRGWVDGEQVVLEVEDTGIGIDPEEQKRLFQPYEQADSSMTAMGGGIGLGLSISQQLARLHHGSLEVESAPGRGSRFRLVLPLATAELSDDDIPSAPDSELRSAAVREAAASSGREQTAASAESKGREPRVLMVDDDPLNLRILQGMLPRHQYHVVGVGSGQEALRLIDGEEWDLVVADVMMPRMSGYELTGTIRKRFSMSELPVLLLTARSQPEDIAAGFLAGANDYVTKPADSLELQHRVRALTELKLTVGERLRMEAAWLQAQVQPHFLFNTLNTIAALSEIDPDRMRLLMVAFGNYLQGSFDFRNFDRVVPLSRELELVKAYLYIEQERFAGRMKVEWDIPERLLSTPVPPLAIQTLVENGVRHGILRRSSGGTVRIGAREVLDQVEIRVADDGVGIEEAMLRQMLDDPSVAHGIGLRNTNRRLNQIYGRGLDIASVPGQGTVITFLIGRPDQ
ncbi:ATP-binding response regulator [Paenibacillus cymbidii]|uniref:ATP-binding response regulator n=1 Tax=Paenibacillus cymbidii TaxID=1639034 RepID=UPI001081C0A7|nr:ATP-binding protein [Paenibacillus cymbidii]